MTERDLKDRPPASPPCSAHEVDPRYMGLDPTDDDAPPSDVEGDGGAGVTQGKVVGGSARRVYR
ncbi:hypothetical protein OCGS_2665 [Oceaniovalibus guishaninsula JLT2003]|uniref:Uncharacterized protein n=1 Tax=Oceaniovalibus guishaninsula JLT2003 TaxID=1231392 RepID=K2HJ95_9RHOB|nr:hypothetical protein [Oceaniovalibus guishaninsula]EKE43074.1 hypothetical protein OCGS_2665 [Oceaniovalibus guishaninsula JLT2003]